MSAERQIRYTKTSDGVSIAYTVSGTGPTLVDMPAQPISHQLLMRKAFARSYADMGRWFRTVTYDVRGSGMSDRVVTDFALETMLLDLDAVVQAAAPESFALSASWDSVPVAIAYGARHPERVSHLVLAEGWMSFADYEEGQALEIERALRDADWNLNSETIARVLLGFEGDEAVHYAEYFRACVDKATWKASQEAIESYDVRSFIGAIEAETLVLHNKQNRWLPVDVGRRLASNIKRSQLVIYAAILISRNSAIEDFFREGATDASRPSTHGRVRTPDSHATGTAVILFTDIVDSTALTERLGDARFREASRALDAGLRAAIRDASGASIDGKLLGDGLLATFPSAAQAIDGARRCLALSAASELGLHIGLHAGDVIREEGNVFGGAVNIASRICGLSAPGEILVSDVVRGMARSSSGVEFEDRGEQEMKGVGEPVSRRTPMDGRAGRGLIACDLDGTLLRSDGTLSPRTVASIRRAEAAGWIFVMVTGRPVRRILHVAEEAGLNGIALCSNGAIVFDLQTHTMVDGHPIEPAIATALVGDLREAIDGVYFAFELGLQFGREDAYPRRMHPIDAAAQVDERVGDALELASSPVHKLIVAHPERDFDRLLHDVTTIAGDRAEVTHSARDFIEVSARGVDKASGTRLLAKQLGIDARNAVAIGDMPNDLPMLAWAGLAVAVGNAHPDVLRAAQRVVAANDDDGVADILDSLA